MNFLRARFLVATGMIGLDMSWFTISLFQLSGLLGSIVSVGFMENLLYLKRRPTFLYQEMFLL